MNIRCNDTISNSGYVPVDSGGSSRFLLIPPLNQRNSNATQSITFCIHK